MVTPKKGCPAPLLAWSPGTNSTQGSTKAPSEQPGDHAAWTVQAQSQLSSARALRQQAAALQQGSPGSISSRARPSSTLASTSVSSSATIAATVAAAVSQDRWKKKCAVSNNIAIAVQDRLQTTHSAIRRVSQVVMTLQRANGTRFAALSVAEKRLELRDKRPATEMISDSFQQALEQECEALKRIRERLVDKIEAGQDVFDRLGRLHEELNSRRHTLHMDRSNRPHEFLGEVCSSEDAGARFCTEAAALLEATQREADRAMGQTVAAMKRRISELVESRRELEGEVHQTRCSIVETEQHLGKVKSRLRNHSQAPERQLGEDFLEGWEHSQEFSASESSPAHSAEFANIRSRIMAAAYTGHAGRQLDVLFARFDKDGSGELDEDELRRALRRTLRIPPSAVSDAEIAHLVSVLDADQSGSVSIAELVKFLGATDDVQLLQEQSSAAQSMLEQLHAAREDLQEDLRRKTIAWRIDDSCVKVTASKALELDTFPVPGKPREAGGLSVARKRKLHNLTPEALEKLRSKLQSAAYTGHAGRQLEVLFSRFDKDGSGQLDDAEVHKALRRTLRIPDSVITDSEISSLCSMLDRDDSQTVSISELIAFIGPEPEVSKRTGKPVPGVTLAPINTGDAKGAPGGVSTPASLKTQPSVQRPKLTIETPRTAAQQVSHRDVQRA